MRKILCFLFLFLFITNICFCQVNLNLGLKAYYPFSGNANDASGNNNNPVFNNATLTSDRFGNPNSAYHFNGTNSYMQILNNPTINSTNQLSVCAWVKPQGFYAGPCHGNSMMMKGDADYLTGNYALRFDDGPFTNYSNCSIPAEDILHQNFYGVGAVSSPPGYSPYIQTNQWYSVIVTDDGTTAKLYVNCELKASVPQGNATFTNGYDLYLGKLNSASFPYWLNGDLDEVRIYDRALTVDEVNVLSGCPVSSPAPVTSFTAPDTVCLNSPVNIQNTSQGATNYYWNFCTANINQPPIGTNLGNVGGLLSKPVYIDYVFTNGNLLWICYQ